MTPAVSKLVGASEGGVAGRRAVVLAGTGPVGARAAGLLARLGAEVMTISSRDAGRGAVAAERIAKRFGGRVEHVTLRDSAQAPELLRRAEEVYDLAAGL